VEIANVCYKYEELVIISGLSSQRRINWS